MFATYSGIYWNAFIDQKDPSACNPKTLLVINPKDGSLIGKYALKYKTSELCLSEDNERLYLWNIEPEVSIERYNVKDILNAK